MVLVGETENWGSGDGNGDGGENGELRRISSGIYYGKCWFGAALISVVFVGIRSPPRLSIPGLRLLGRNPL